MVDDDVLRKLAECVDSNRVDALCLVLERCSAGDLGQLSSRLCTDDGTLLHRAARLNRVDCLRSLLAHDLDPTVVNENGQTAFDVAQSEACQRAFNQCLLQAVAQDRLDRVAQLVASGLPVDMPDSVSSCNTAMHWAAMYSSSKMASALVSIGFDLGAINAMGDTPLHLALKRQDADMIRCLTHMGADWHVKNREGFDCVDLAKDNKALMELRPLASADEFQNQLSEPAVASEPSPSSRSDISVVAVNGDVPKERTLKLFETGEFEKRQSAESADQWYRLLWPRPKELYVSNVGAFGLSDQKLSVYFFAHSTVCAMEMLNCWQALSHLWKTVAVEVDFKHDVAHGLDQVDPSSVVCGVFPDRFCRSNSYELTMSDCVVQLIASDLVALGYAIHALLQVVRLCLRPSQAIADRGHLPLIRVRDWPSRKIRALLLDLAGCRLYTPDTINQITVRIAHVRATHLILRFEARVCDKFSLPYDRQQLFSIMEVCQSLMVNLVPSLELNSSDVDASVLCAILGEFCQLFPLADTIMIGSFLGEAIQKHASCASLLFWRFPTILWTVQDCSQLAPCQKLPPHCILVVDADQVTSNDVMADMNGQQHAVCFAVRSCPEGFFCQDAAVLKARCARLSALCSGSSCVGVVVCDYSTGYEVVPHCFSYLATLAAVGIGWNGRVDVNDEMVGALPSIAAEHLMNSGEMRRLFENVLQAARMEHCLAEGMPISMFVQVLLNPNNLDMEKYSAKVFKKARVDLQRCYENLETAIRSVPYNFELALCVAEVQLVFEMMVLGARIAQSLCSTGTNPRGTNYAVSVVNPGVGNLPATVRTDLANRLLKIRARFQQAWLSRNMVSSLNNALKVFDNLFRDLLPPALQAFGENLL